MTELSERLESLGLTQYLEAFVSEGFDTWETIQDITESDLCVSTICKLPSVLSLTLYCIATISTSSLAIAG